MSSHTLSSSDHGIGSWEGYPSLKPLQVEGSNDIVTDSRVAKISPIRRSLRNFFTVLRKPRTKQGITGVEPDTVLESGGSLTNTTLQSVFRLQGQVFYLSSLSTRSASTWLLCAATFSGDELRLLSMNCPTFNHAVDISRCTDVRSISFKGLGSRERLNCPETLADLKIFELEFEDNTVETFAVTSAKERALWISAIGDKFLPLRGSKQEDDEKKHHHPALHVETNLARHSSQRRSIISPSIYSSRQSSQFTSPTEPPPRSPSITNLKQLSVVKLRLSQISQKPPSVTSETSSPTCSLPGLRDRAESELPFTLKNAPPAKDIGPQIRQTERKRRPLVNGDAKADELRLTSSSGPRSPVNQLNTSQVDLPSLRELMQALPEQISSMLKSSSVSPSREISKSIERIQGHIQQYYESSMSMKEQLVSRQTSWQEQVEAQSAEVTAIANVLKELSEKVVDIPIILHKLEEFIGQDKGSISPQMVLNNLPPQSNGGPDLSSIITKLDQVLQACSKPANFERDTASIELDQADLLPLLNKMVSLFENDSGRLSRIIQQQQDSGRYLNELNNWLATFVNTNTSEAEVRKKEYGDLQQAVQKESASNKEEQSALSSRIGALSLSMDEYKDVAIALEASMKNVLSFLTHDTHGAKILQEFSDKLEQQSADHQNALRAFVSEIVSEIRGERLRFVEAMKEATAINVQHHIEQFKRELTREVFEMTEEVRRLHGEKQTLERQIAELFTFYTKHETAGPHAMNLVDRTFQQSVSSDVGGRPTSSRSRSRPLPRPQEKCHL